MDTEIHLSQQNKRKRCSLRSRADKSMKVIDELQVLDIKHKPFQGLINPISESSTPGIFHNHG